MGAFAKFWRAATELGTGAFVVSAGLAVIGFVYAAYRNLPWPFLVLLLLGAVLCLVGAYWIHEDRAAGGQDEPTDSAPEPTADEPPGTLGPLKSRMQLTVTPGPPSAARTVQDLVRLDQRGLVLQLQAPERGGGRNSEHLDAVLAWVSEIQAALQTRWPNHFADLTGSVKEHNTEMWTRPAIEARREAIQRAADAIRREYDLDQ